MSGLLELAARCEAATGPDRELDCAIGVALGWFYTEPNKGWPDRLDYIERHGEVWSYPGSGFDQLVPCYTASLDAAMTLVPEEWAIERWMIWPGEPSTLTLLETQRVGDQWVRYGSMAKVEAAGSDAALALCAAALRARATGSSGDSK